MLCFPPAEIIFLRAVMPVYPANHADIIFDITEGNLRDSFDIIKRYMDGMTVGEWPETFRSVQPPPRPPSQWPCGGPLCQAAGKTSLDQPRSHLNPPPKSLLSFRASWHGLRCPPRQSQARSASWSWLCARSLGTTPVGLRLPP